MDASLTTFCVCAVEQVVYVDRPVEKVRRGGPRFQRRAPSSPPLHTRMHTRMHTHALYLFPQLWRPSSPALPSCFNRCVRRRPSSPVTECRALPSCTESSASSESSAAPGRHLRDILCSILQVVEKVVEKVVYVERPVEQVSRGRARLGQRRPRRPFKYIYIYIYIYIMYIIILYIHNRPPPNPQRPRCPSKYILCFMI
jgi:hypothetical protein